MQQVGIVIERIGKRALIRGERASTCGSCAGKSSCGTLGSWKERPMEMDVDNRMGAEVGDEVVIEVPDSLVLKSAFVLYAVPMLLFFVAGIIAWMVGERVNPTRSDLWAAVTGLAAVAIYYFSGIFNKSNKKGLDAQIVQIQTRTDGGIEVVKLNCHQTEKP